MAKYKKPKPRNPKGKSLALAWIAATAVVAIGATQLLSQPQIPAEGQCIEYRVYGHYIQPTGLDQNADGYVTVRVLDGVSCVGYIEEADGRLAPMARVLFDWAAETMNGHEDWIRSVTTIDPRTLVQN